MQCIIIFVVFTAKVRRLYDIANILSSLQLIQKVHIHNIQSGRKPGFRWIGMDLDKLEMQKKQPSKFLSNTATCTYCMYIIPVCINIASKSIPAYMMTHETKA